VLWSRWKGSAAGAFDGPADFAAHDLNPGGHDVTWWQHAAPAQLTFAGRALS